MCRFLHRRITGTSHTFTTKLIQLIWYTFLAEIQLVTCWNFSSFSMYKLRTSGLCIHLLGTEWNETEHNHKAEKIHRLWSLHVTSLASKAGAPCRSLVVKRYRISFVSFKNLVDFSPFHSRRVKGETSTMGYSFNWFEETWEYAIVE